MISRRGVPDTIGRYTILERVSPPGAAAEVFKARDEDGVLVCIKRVHALAAGDDEIEFVARFEQEIHIARGLEHINIVSVHDHGHEDGAYYVMEWVDGVSLHELFRAVSYTHLTLPTSPKV